MLSRGAAPPPSRATRSVAQSEARKRRASERRYVGSCTELGGFERVVWRHAEHGESTDTNLRDSEAPCNF
jgi:hypothetical protein